jgi:hypothetical protein
MAEEPGQPEPELALTKLEAAKRQLETAIRLYFEDSDPVSIHTLTAAAYQVIEDLDSKRRSTGTIVKDQLVDYLTREDSQILRHKIREAENLFKQADRDPDATLPFRPRKTELRLVDACLKYRELTDENVALFTLFVAWYLARSDFTLLGEFGKQLDVVRGDPILKDRRGFFREWFPIVVLLVERYPKGPYSGR